MNVEQIIKERQSLSMSDYSDEEIAEIEGFGWREFGMGIKDTIRAVLDDGDDWYGTMLDYTYC